jgi:RNA polymerase sigma factor (sigma-70 family)
MHRWRIDGAGWQNLLKRITSATRRPMDAEDLMHSAFLRMQEYSITHQVENPAAFLVRTAVNLSIDGVRRDTSRREDRLLSADFVEIADPTPLQDEVLVARNRLDKVRLALNELTPRTRTIFLMHRIDGLKYREIAARLGVTVSAVEKHIAKAVLHLASHADEF